MKTLELSSAAQRPTRLSFHLPAELEAREPPELRGVPRDGVRMLVAERGSGVLTHSRFNFLPAFVEAGDLIVINTSGVIPGAVPAISADGRQLLVHLSTQLDRDLWVIELRAFEDAAQRTSTRWRGPSPRLLRLAGGGTIELCDRYLGSDRLWTAHVCVGSPVLPWLGVHGRPIRYGYVESEHSIEMYQNVYADEPGSAEMPSAGRPFSAEVITRLVTKGVGVAPLVLHTGVASLEANETPYPERVKVPVATAERVNATRARGSRVIAVGTTVVRALESAAGANGVVGSLDGWTDLVITPERGVRVVDGLLTGWHEPEASHLLLLEAIAGRELLEHSYAASLRAGYLWHEFGDVHLILP